MGASERDEEARDAFTERLKNLDPNKLVFVDESGTNITLAPLCMGGHPKESGSTARLRETGRRTSRSSPPYLLKKSQPL